MSEEKSFSDEIIDRAKESEETGGASFMNPEGKKAKKPRGRPKKEASDKFETKSSDPKKSEAESKISQIPTKVICYPIVKAMSVGAVYAVKDPRAAATPDEAEGLAEAMALVFDKHLPDLLSKYGAESMLCLALGQWGIRLVAIAKIKKSEAEKAAEQAKHRPRPQESVNTVDLDAMNNVNL